MDVLFLDANVIFSAAYTPESRLRLLWDVPDAELVTSEYAADEALRNLPQPQQRARCTMLLRRTRMVPEADLEVLPHDVLLPEKDRPILAAAIACGATHLITGDRQHFGVWFGKSIGTLTVYPPAGYVDMRLERQTERRRRVAEPGGQ